MGIHSDERIAKMHPRQQAILEPLSVEERDAVVAHAYFRQNISGGIFSGNLQLAVHALKQAGSPEALRAQDSEDNAKLMMSAKAWR